MKVYLITHAHTEPLANVSADSWRLSERGMAEAQELAKADFWGEVDRIVISSEAKTWLTVAGVVKSRSLPVWIDSRFDELRRRGWIEEYPRQVAAVFAAPSRSVGGWEAVEAVQHRVLCALYELPRRFANETLAVVGHGLCLSILRAKVLSQERLNLDAWQNLAFASYACVRVEPLAMLQDFPLTHAPLR